MSDNDDYNDDEQDDGQEEQFVRLSPKDLRALRKKANQADEQAAKLKGYERDLAFLKVGISSDDAKLKYFVKAYDGELTVEAIRAAAEEAGFLQPVAPEVPKGELADHERVANASAGADGSNIQPDFDERLKSAKSADEVMKILADANMPTTYNRP